MDAVGQAKEKGAEAAQMVVAAGMQGLKYASQALK